MPELDADQTGTEPKSERLGAEAEGVGCKSEARLLPTEETKLHLKFGLKSDRATI